MRSYSMRATDPYFFGHRRDIHAAILGWVNKRIGIICAVHRCHPVLFV